MKYHIMVAPKQLTVEELKLPQLRGSFNVDNNEYMATVKKLAKEDKRNSDSDFYYIHDECSMKKLAEKLRDGDEIILHAEGQPFFLGLHEPSQYDLPALKLAKLLKAYKIPDFNININLLACHSASQYKEMNFAKDTSEALFHVFGYKNITVSGYTGYVKVKSPGKYSVSSELEHDRRGTHASLQDAKMTYACGELVQKGKALSDLSKMGFDWAKKYIANTLRAKEVVKFAKEAAPSPGKLTRTTSHASFFKPSSASDSSALDSSDLTKQATASKETGRAQRSQSVSNVTDEPASKDPVNTGKFRS